MTSGQVYQCGLCDKKFKTSDFVIKHILNKHADILDQKFNKHRYADMMKENYLNDPRKMVNIPAALPVGGLGSGYGAGDNGF